MENIDYIWNSVKDFAMLYGAEVIKVILILFVGIWAINKICHISTVFLRQSNLELSLVSFFSSILKLFLRIILILLLLSVIGINLTSVITAIGASLVTFGLVFKDSFSNFAGGIMIIVNRPIRVGDYIEFENVKGIVTKIEMMFTTLRTQDESSVIIPNFRLATNNIVRKSPYDICKLDINYVILGNNKNLDINKILQFSLDSNSKVLQVPPPKIDFENTSEKEAIVKIELFCEKRYADDMKTEIESGLKLAFKRYNLEIK